jgi:hypothetical protein
VRASALFQAGSGRSADRARTPTHARTHIAAQATKKDGFEGTPRARTAHIAMHVSA